MASTSAASRLPAPSPSPVPASDGSFTVQCLGQIESGALQQHDFLYCRYLFSFGADWDVAAGIDSGLSQTACLSSSSSSSSSNSVTWNFPIDVSFKATNIHGWPRIAISVYGIDYLGRDVIRGYGSALIPLQPGMHQLNVDMFTPIANSPLNQLASWLMGNPPEFFDSRFVCQGEGREVSRVTSTGTVKVNLQVVIKGCGAAS